MGTYTANLLHELLRIDSTLRILLVADQAVPASTGLDPKRVRVLTSASRARNNFFWSNFALTRALREQRSGAFPFSRLHRAAMAPAPGPGNSS